MTVQVGDRVRVPNAERGIVTDVFRKDGEDRVAVVVEGDDRETVFSCIDVGVCLMWAGVVGSFRAHYTMNGQTTLCGKTVEDGTERGWIDGASWRCRECERESVR